MFVVNLKKCKEIFDKVYICTESEEIAELARLYQAIPIMRNRDLCGDTPNIPVYQHAIKFMDKCDGIVAVQANSPTIDLAVIKRVKRAMQVGFEEVMTCHYDRRIYGSVWAITKEKLKNYADPYKPQPDLLIEDLSIDIHTRQDYEKALKDYNK